MKEGDWLYGDSSDPEYLNGNAKVYTDLSALWFASAKEFPAHIPDKPSLALLSILALRAILAMVIAVCEVVVAAIVRHDVVKGSFDIISGCEVSLG